MAASISRPGYCSLVEPFRIGTPASDFELGSSEKASSLEVGLFLWSGKGGLPGGVNVDQHPSARAGSLSMGLVRLAGTRPRDMPPNLPDRPPNHTRFTSSRSLGQSRDLSARSGPVAHGRHLGGTPRRHLENDARSRSHQGLAGRALPLEERLGARLRRGGAR
jgi:hypothetical protein